MNLKYSILTMELVQHEIPNRCGFVCQGDRKNDQVRVVLRQIVRHHEGLENPSLVQTILFPNQVKATFRCAPTYCPQTRQFAFPACRRYRTWPLTHCVGPPALQYRPA